MEKIDIQKEMDITVVDMANLSIELMKNIRNIHLLRMEFQKVRDDLYRMQGVQNPDVLGIATKMHFLIEQLDQITGHETGDVGEYKSFCHSNFVADIARL